MKTLHVAVAEIVSRPGEIVAFISKLGKTALLPIDAEASVEGVVWSKLWDFIHSKSISQTGLDVSEVGSTWVAGLANAEAIRPFSDDEAMQINQSGTLFAALEKQSVLNGRTWSIPWMADTRVIYYRRSLLEAAGVKEEDAFATIENMAETMERLSAIEKPGWGSLTTADNNCIHLLAPWVWAKGGGFISKDEKHTAFCEKQSIEGLLRYFNLAQYGAREFHSFDDVITAFKFKQVATMIDGPWVWIDFRKERDAAVDLNDIGLALPPGPAFVGGSNLVIWRQTGDNLAAAVALVKLLSAGESQYQACTIKRLLPVRQESFQGPPYSLDPAYRVFANALKTGCNLPSLPIWAPLESSLLKAFGLIWETAKHNAFEVKEAHLLRHLEPLARRFDKMMEMF